MSSFHGLSDYGGPDEIHLGDGNSLNISHTGHTIFPTTTRNLSLYGVLCVPKLRTNLVSVSQLCKTNSVSVEFFPSCFFVKDFLTGALLLQGDNIHDVYCASMSRQPQLNVSTLPSLLDLHHSFGHPSNKTLR